VAGLALRREKASVRWLQILRGDGSDDFYRGRTFLATDGRPVTFAVRTAPGLGNEPHLWSQSRSVHKGPAALAAPPILGLDVGRPAYTYLVFGV